MLVRGVFASASIQDVGPGHNPVCLALRQSFWEQACNKGAIKEDSRDFWGHFPQIRLSTPSLLGSLLCLALREGTLLRIAFCIWATLQFIKRNLSFDPCSSPIFEHLLSWLLRWYHSLTVRNPAPAQASCIIGITCLHPGKFLCLFKSEIICGLASTRLTKR